MPRGVKSLDSFSKTEVGNRKIVRVLLGKGSSVCVINEDDHAQIFNAVGSDDLELLLRFRLAEMNFTIHLNLENIMEVLSPGAHRIPTISDKGGCSCREGRRSST